MKSENKLKNLAQKIMITFLNFLESQMKEGRVFIHAILTKEKFGLKMKKEIFLLFMQTETQLKKCLFLLI